MFQTNDLVIIRSSFVRRRATRVVDKPAEWGFTLLTNRVIARHSNATYAQNCSHASVSNTRRSCYLECALLSLDIDE